MAETNLKTAVSQVLEQPFVSAQERRYRCADVILDVRIASRATEVATALLRALAHLQLPDDDSAPAQAPSFEVEFDVELPDVFRHAHYPEGIYTDGTSHAEPQVAVHWSEGLKVFYDFSLRRCLIVWQKPVEPHEIGAPLRFVLSWLLRGRDVFLVHAAAIRAPQGHTALIAGPGGSGKSTVSLAALLTPGWTFLGDDYVLVARDAQGAFVAHTLYATGKLTDEALAREPMFRAIHDRCPHLRYVEKQKWIYLLRDAFAGRIINDGIIRCLVAPAHSRAPRPARGPEASAAHPFVRLQPGPALRTLAPTTLFQDLMPSPSGFHALAALVRRVPCFNWALTADSAHNLDALAAHLVDL